MATIFLDMDGVVADFDKYANEILGYSTPGGKRYPLEDWAKISANPRFYRHLDVCLGAELLVNKVRQLAKLYGYDVKFLTAIPRQNDVPWAFWDKIKWIEARWPKIPVWFGPHSNEKCQHCRPDDILIDDRPSNIEEWRAAGGKAILHEGDVVATLFELRSLVKGMSVK